MAQVIKALAGTVINLPFKEGLRTTAGITYKNTDAINYLENNEYRKRYADYRNMNDDLRNLFYAAVDKYSLDIKDGRLDFNDSGITNKEELDLDLYTIVNDYFVRGILGNRIVPYDESDKDLYKPNLSRIIASNVFNNEDLDENSLIQIWDSLDELDPKTGIRKTTNRQKQYADALRKEADKLENDLKYSNTFRHTGWQSDIYANKKTAERLRIHAAEIENTPDINKTEVWYKNAALSNLTPDEVKKFFGDASDTNNDTQSNLTNGNSTVSDASQEGEGEENYLPDGYNNIDPLSKKDIEIVLGGKRYKVNDLWQSINNDQVKEMAQAILSAYGRQLIKHNWTYWRGHKGYLENLTGLFEGRESSDFLGIYSISPGALTNVGKKFYIRTQNHQYPVEVTIIQNNDGTYIAKDAQGNTYNLGRYNPNNWKTASRALHDTNDVGKPFAFNIDLLNKSALAVRQYLLDTITHINPNKFPPLMWANILMQLSYYFDVKAKNGLFEIQIPNNGSKLRLGGERGTGKPVTSFEWTLGQYGIRFTFNKNGTWILGKSKNGRLVRYLNPEALKSVEIIRPLRKLGGKISKLLYGGISDMVNFQQQYGTAYDYQTGYALENNKNKKEDVTSFNNLSKKLKLASDKEFTVADGIRTAAAGMDLLSAMLMFVPGTNIAGAVGTGVSVFGYLTSDIIDGIQGRQKFSDIVLNDALLVGTMAVPMFINPLRAKALGMGEKTQRAAKAFSKWFGWAIGAGMIANEETRKSLLNTISKISNGEITKLNSQDATNIAFMVRMAGGVKEGINARKYNKALKESRVANGKAYVDYSYKEGNEVILGTPIEVTDLTNLSIRSLKELILDQINQGRAEEAKIKAEDINIKEADKNYIKKIGEFGQKYYYKLKKKEPATNPQSKEPQAAIRLELGEETEMSPLFAKIFQKTKFENGKPERANTAVGRFIRETLGFEDFDVFFSDYSTVKNYRLGKLRRLVENYYKPLDELREQGKTFSDIIKQEGLSEAQINQQLAKAMRNYGFLEDDPAVIDYARRLANYYDTDLARYDNLLLALMALDKEIAAESARGKTPIDPTKHAESLLNTHKLDYLTEAGATPEELQEAYNLFLREKLKPLELGSTASLLKQLLSTEKPKNNSDRRQLVNRVFSSFNSDIITPIQIDLKQMVKLLLKLPSVKKGLTLKYGQLNPKLNNIHIRKGLLELVDKNVISQELANRLLDADVEEKLLELINTDPKFFKYLELAISEKLTGMWELLKNNPIIKTTIKNGNILTEETLREVFNTLIEQGKLTDEVLGDFRRSFLDDDIIVNELNNRFNLKTVRSLIETFTNNEKLEAKSKLYEAWALNHGIDITAEQNPYAVNGRVFYDIMDALGIPEIIKIKLRNRKEFPESFKSIFLMAKKRLETPEVALPVTPSPEPKPKPKVKRQIKNIFSRKNTNANILEARLSEIQEYIREHAKETLTSQSASARLNQLLERMKLHAIIDEEEYNMLKSKHFNSLKKLIPKHYFGGNLEFANLVIKLQGGNKIHGILWTSGNQNWGTEVGPRAWKYIFDLLNQGNTGLLGYGEGSLYDLGNQYVPLREEYDKNYAKDNYSLQSDAVNKYLQDYFNAMPGYQSNVLGELYSLGRYTRNGQLITGDLPEEGNIYRTKGMAAGTADLEGLGNIKRLTPEEIASLLKLQQESWTGGQLYYDVNTGTIFPLANGVTPQEGSLLLSDYNTTGEADNAGADIGTGTGASADTTLKLDDAYWEAEKKRLFGEWYDEKGNFIGVKNPQPGTDVVKGAPINQLRLASIFGTNLANILAYNELIPEAYKQMSPHGVHKVFRDISKVAEADAEYAPYLGRNLSSDMRYNQGFMLNILSAHHKARQEGYNLNRSTFKESYEKALEGRRQDTINAFNVANENRKTATNAENLRKQYKAQQIITNADNWKNFIDTLTAEMAADQKIKNAHNLQNKAAMYLDAFNSSVTAKRQNVYNAVLNSLSSNPKALEKFKAEYPDSTTPFQESEYTPAQYRQWLDEYTEQQKLNMYLNLEELFNASWDTRRFWEDVTYPFYKLDWTGGLDYQKEKERLEQTKKLGGKINMAKKGGASINWVRVENARMLNKSILNDIKHTYESLKEANKEMQRNIRAMAPLIRLLSKTETVKLK